MTLLSGKKHKDHIEEFCELFNLGIQLVIYLLEIASRTKYIKATYFSLFFLQVRVISSMVMVQDIFDEEFPVKVRTINTIIYTTLLYMNNIMTQHCYSAKRALFMSIFVYTAFMIGFYRRIFGESIIEKISQNIIPFLRNTGLIIFFMYTHTKLSNIHVDVMIDTQKANTELKVISRVQKETQ
jgi:hypothetical protein